MTRKHSKNNAFLLVLRSGIFLLGQALATILIASIGLLIFFTPYKIRYWWITRWSHFIIWWAKLTCGIEYEVKGLENLPKTNAIVLSKHQSAWETLFFQTLLPPQSWVLKRELLWIPFFGWALALLEPIAINRANRAAVKQLQSEGIKRLKQGRWVIIFPEGTRVSPGNSRPYSRSGAALSIASSNPIVPVAHNAGICWPKNGFIKYPGKITVIIGPAIYPQSQTLDSVHQAAEHWIEKTQKTL